MQVQTIRKNAEPFGTEYSCMMMIVVKGKLVVVKSNSAEGKAIQNIVLNSKRISPNSQPKEAGAKDINFFFKQLRTKAALK